MSVYIYIYIYIYIYTYIYILKKENKRHCQIIDILYKNHTINNFLCTKDFLNCNIHTYLKRNFVFNILIALIYFMKFDISRNVIWIICEKLDIFFYFIYFKKCNVKHRYKLYVYQSVHFIMDLSFRNDSFCLLILKTTYTRKSRKTNVHEATHTCK